VERLAGVLDLLPGERLADYLDCLAHPGQRAVECDAVQTLTSSTPISLWNSDAVP
jgi:hypothetical protein